MNDEEKQLLIKEAKKYVALTITIFIGTYAALSLNSFVTHKLYAPKKMPPMEYRMHKPFMSPMNNSWGNHQFGKRHGKRHHRQDMRRFDENRPDFEVFRYEFRTERPQFDHPQGRPQFKENQPPQDKRSNARTFEKKVQPQTVKK